jgi:hypothetical protein
VLVNRELSIRHGDLVLDVGSGHDPHPLAAVLVDRYPEDSTHRYGYPLVADRPVIVADISNLPFGDGTFDYAIASHVLEHTEDPLAAATELSRVSRRGYVETPSELWEFFFGWDFHTHAVNLDESGAIVFRRKRQPLSPISKVGHRLAERDLLLGEMVGSHPELFYVSVEWDGQLRCRLGEGTWPDDIDAEALIRRMRIVRPTLRQAARIAVHATVPASVRRRVARLLTGRPRPRPRQATAPQADLRRILACPACHAGPLAWAEAALNCPGCARSYPRQGNNLVLLLQGAKEGSAREVAP